MGIPFSRLQKRIKKPCKKITPYDVASLVRKAFKNVASISKGESRFRAFGIVPLNPEIFTEKDFIAAEILQSETIAIQDCNESLAAARDSSTSTIPSTSKEVPNTSKRIHPPVLRMSKQVGPLDSEPDIVSPVPGTSNQISAYLHDLIKFPEKTPVINARKGRKNQHATTLTSTPIKEDLIEKENKKMKKTGSKEKE